MKPNKQKRKDAQNGQIIHEEETNAWWLCYDCGTSSLDVNWYDTETDEAYCTECLPDHIDEMLNHTVTAVITTENTNELSELHTTYDQENWNTLLEDNELVNHFGLSARQTENLSETQTGMLRQLCQPIQMELHKNAVTVTIHQHLPGETHPGIQRMITENTNLVAYIKTGDKTQVVTP